MSLSIGIVGLPNVGKSTLFNALTQNAVSAENFPFCTIDPTTGTVAVPDERLLRLSELSSSEKTIPAVVEFVDIAGLVRGAANGEGLGNEFLSHIRHTDAIAHVVRVFDKESVIHVDGTIHPSRDVETIHTELCNADKQIIEKRILQLEKEIRKNTKDAQLEKDILEDALQHIEKHTLLRSIYNNNSEALEYFRKIGTLTTKPIIFILNYEASGKNKEEGDKEYDELITYLEKNSFDYITVDIFAECSISEVHEAEEEYFRQEMGVKDNGIQALIEKSYSLLQLITFFTTGEKETRAWTIQNGSTVKEAGSAIHTDFTTNFIKAEVISFDDFILSGSFSRAREQGTLRTEGKEYIVKDGDVIIYK